MLNLNLKSAIIRLWDKFSSGGISDPLTAIEQISYLLFMKRLDELDIKKRKDAAFTGEIYKSIFREDKENFRWSHFRQMEGGEMVLHIQSNVFPFLKTLDKKENPFAKHMGTAVFIISKPSLLVEAVNIIDEIFEEISNQEKFSQGFQDTQGDLFEYLLTVITLAGKPGQFRTPRHIIQLICELVDPKLGDSISDLAGGTAGFLLGAFQHIKTTFTSMDNRTTNENGLIRGDLGNLLTDDRLWKYLKEKALYGYDIDESMVRVGLMNLMMHGISNPNFDRKDTLSKKFDDNNRYDVIMTNPPFKGSINKSDINESLSLATTKTELLFINKIIQSLKIGGRGGVIVPDGVLFGTSNAHKQARKMLLDECELQGIISMPSGVFKPYTSVCTAILLFVKGGVTEKVWFYDMESDGYTLDDKRTKIDGGDLPEIIEKWKTRKCQTENNRNSKFFYVTKKEIETNDLDLSIKRYKTPDYEETQYEDPSEILTKIETLEKEIITELNELKNLL